MRETCAARSRRTPSSRGRRAANARPRWLRRFFSVLGQLRHGLVGAAYDEERVVAEPARAARGPGDDPLAHAGDRPRLAAAGERIDEREDAAEACPKPVAGGRLAERRERAEEGRVVLGVGGPLVGEARAPHARTAVEHVDLEARVVGDGQHHRDARDGAGLLDGVLLEGRAVLDHLRGRSQDLGRSHDLDRQAREQRTELFELSAVARRDDQRVPLRAHGRSLSTSSLSTRRASRGRPRRARARSAAPPRGGRCRRGRGRPSRRRRASRPGRPRRSPGSRRSCRSPWRRR